MRLPLIVSVVVSSLPVLIMRDLNLSPVVNTAAPFTNQVGG